MQMFIAGEWQDRSQKIEVTRSRAYKKNDQAFVEQKNGAVVRRLIGYGRFDGVETAKIMARLYASSRLHVNYFQPSFKLKEKRREGAKVIKRYHSPATPYERAMAHPKLPKAIMGAAGEHDPGVAGGCHRVLPRRTARRGVHPRRAQRLEHGCAAGRCLRGGVEPDAAWRRAR